ncbi:MAG TPA: hypothetical protein VGG13_03530 [Candidatus Saccharimonadales bacterium]|jgi:hypothetical protein
MGSVAETYGDKILLDRYVAPNPDAGLRKGVLFGVLAAGGVVSLDLLSQQILWGRGVTEVIADTSAGSEEKQRWLAVPGLGQPEARFIKEAVGDDLPGKVDYVKLSGGGISGKSMGQALAPYFMQTRPKDGRLRPAQNVLLSSMGLPTYLMGVQ